MLAAAQSLRSAVGRRRSAPVVELDSGVCPSLEPAARGWRRPSLKRRSSWFGRSSSRSGRQAASPRRRSSWFGRSSSSSTRHLLAAPEEPSQEGSLLSSYQRGDLDLLEACLATIDQFHPIEDMFRKLSSRGRVRAADWSNALQQEFGLDEDFVARFDHNPGAHVRALRGAALRRLLTTSSPTSSSRGRRASGRSSSWSAPRLSFGSLGTTSRSEGQGPAADLQRVLGLLSRIMRKRRQAEASGRGGHCQDLDSEDFQGTLEAVQQARDCAQHLLHLASCRNARDAAAIPSPAGYVELLLEHAAAAARRGLHRKVHEDLKALLLLRELEPSLAVRSCLHGRPPVAQLLGFVLRAAARGLLAQERDEAAYPEAFGSLELGLRLCAELTRLNKALAGPQQPPRASSAPRLSAAAASWLSRRRASDPDAASAAAAGERLLNILHPQTVYLALAPAAFVPDRTMVESLLRAGWGFLDESIAPDPSCKVRALLADLARHLGVAPPEGAGPGKESGGSGLADAGEEVAASTVGAAHAIVELDRFVGRNSQVARTAALYGGAFIMERAVGHFEKTRACLRISSADSRRTSVISNLRRDSADSMGHTITDSSRPSREGLQDADRRVLHAETWSGLASTQQLFGVVRPHMPPMFFEGREGQVVPEPSERLHQVLEAQLEQDTKSVRARGWLFPGTEWSDLLCDDVEEIGSTKDGGLGDADSSEGSTEGS